MVELVRAGKDRDRGTAMSDCEIVEESSAISDLRNPEPSTKTDSSGRERLSSIRYAGTNACTPVSK